MRAARQVQPRRMRALTIEAGPASGVHATPEERRVLVPFVPNLPVRVEHGARLDDRQQVMVPKRLPRHEIARELTAPRVARGTDLHGAHWRRLAHSGIRLPGGWPSPLPVHVLL